MVNCANNAKRNKKADEFLVTQFVQRAAPSPQKGNKTAGQI